MAARGSSGGRRRRPGLITAHFNSEDLNGAFVAGVADLIYWTKKESLCRVHSGVED